MPTLPIRIAQCRYNEIDAFDSAYFTFLQKVGCNAIYLQNSPFDPMRTGNVGQFFRHFHLISLFDISRSHRREEYQDYINEICRRARHHDIDVWLDCWEPRLPAHAQAMTHPDWRGRGGWGWHKDRRIAFCWEHPDAVAYWKSMACDAIASLSGIRGLIVSMIDNEAAFCDPTCERCEGRSLEVGILDVFETFTTIAGARDNPLQLAVYDWWMPEPVVTEIIRKLPEGSLLVGRSARGMEFRSADGSWSGEILDISNAIDGVSRQFVAQCRKARTHGLRPIDMVAWSRGLENFFLPAPPDPLFAIRKCRALVESNAEGWIDYDCGSLEDGAIAEAIRLYTASPHSAEEELLEDVLQAIWGQASSFAKGAYALYREAKGWLPTGLESGDVPGLDGRSIGLGFVLFGPWLPADLRFYDTTHAFNFFAPFNLLTPSTIPTILRAATNLERLLHLAWDEIRRLDASTPSARRDRAAFEIHWRNSLSMLGYTRMADAKWNHLQGYATAEDFRKALQEIARTESDNLTHILAWDRANPGQLGNPCHRILGHLIQTWPDADFSGNFFQPKIRSLDFLAREFDPLTFVPSYHVFGSGISCGGEGS
jgi:hypothetical protein